MVVEDLLEDDKEWMELIEGVIIEQPSYNGIAVIYNPSKIDTNALEEYFYHIGRALPGITLSLHPTQSSGITNNAIFKDERIFLIPMNSKNRPIKIKYK